MRAGCGLERVLQPVDRKTAKIAIKQLQVSQYAIRQVPGKGHVLARDQRPVFLSAFGHRPKLGALVAAVLDGAVDIGHLCSPVWHQC